MDTQHSAFLLAISPLLLAVALAAQNPQVQTAPKDVVETLMDKPLASLNRNVVSLDFRGGTLTELGAALRQAGKNVNIVLPESASKVRVPALSLRETGIEAALRAVTTVVEPNVSLDVQTTISSLPGVGPIGEPVFSVRVRLDPNPNVNVTQTVGPSGVGPSGSRAVRVFALRGLTTAASADGSGPKLEVKTILTAIDTGLSVAGEQAAQETGGEGEKALLRYHEDSGLLFIAGTNAQLRVADEVITNLQSQMMQERAQRPAKTQPADKPADDAPPDATKRVNR